MKVRRIGRYHDETRTGEDSGIHIEAVDMTGPRRFQSIANMLLTEEDLRALRAGKEVEIPWLKESDLLTEIAS